MLNGIEPILLFQFSKRVQDQAVTNKRIPLSVLQPSFVDNPPIPVYLSEQATGLFILNEDKNADLDTDVESNLLGTQPETWQKTLPSTISINIQARKDSLGLTLLSSLLDLAYDKTTSQEYAITYLHGPITVFRGLIHSYSISTESNSNKLSIRIELTRGTKQPQKVEPLPDVQRTTAPASELNPKPPGS